MTRTALDLYIEVTTGSGTSFKWDANQAPGSRPQNLSFRTKIGEGFSDASLQLARRIDLDYPDLSLGDSVVITGADGTIVYEGFVAALPRDLGDKHTIGVTIVGWMAHAKDRKFSEIYVDRGLSGWTAPSSGRKAGLLTSGYNPQDPQVNTDGADETAGVTTAVTGDWVTPFLPISEAWYDAGPGNLIGRIAYGWVRGANVNSALTQWSWLVGSSPDDKGTGAVNSGNLRAAGPQAVTAYSPSASNRYAFLQLTFTSTANGASQVQYSVAWNKPTVYGAHNVTLRPGEPGEPDGVSAADVLRDVAQRWCPLLDTSGVQDTDYVIQHCEFRTRTFPYDAFLEVNKFHLWHLGVWENKRLDFRPYDLTDYDWEIRTDDPGTTFSPQGPSTDSLFNGIAVTYTDVATGKVNVLTPDDDPDLADASLENPWNQHGRDHWDEIALSSPTTSDSAVQLARAALADRNRPKTPGTVTVRGYIRDRAGNPQPVSKVRAGETISITNFNDAIRLIVETDCDDEGKTVRLAIDKPFALLDAYLDRQANALQARSLGG